MFGLFGKKAAGDALDEDTILIAGITAGVAFRSIERKHGFTPVQETPEVLEACKNAACQMLSITPDEKSKSVLHMVALTFAMDDSGLAERVTIRYEQGNKSIDRDDAQKVWDLTLKKTREAAAALSRTSGR
jgi:hypothetical protein